MARTKHPRIFAKHGGDAWGELWEKLGPLGERVLKGESVARWDGESMVPELSTSTADICL